MYEAAKKIIVEFQLCNNLIAKLLIIDATPAGNLIECLSERDLRYGRRTGPGTMHQNGRDCQKD